MGLSFLLRNLWVAINPFSSLCQSSYWGTKKKKKKKEKEKEKKEKTESKVYDLDL